MKAVRFAAFEPPDASKQTGLENREKHDESGSKKAGSHVVEHYLLPDVHLAVHKHPK